MLQIIHDRLRGIFAIVILSALGIVFVFWGVDASVGSFAKAQGIEVNGQEIDAASVRQGFQNELSRYQAAFGAAAVPEELRTQLRTQALEQAVRGELIRQRTQKLRYAASDAQVLENIRQIPAFQVAGQFSADAYHAALRSAAIQPEQFEREQRQYALARQVDRGISMSAFVLPAEIDRQVELQGERREIAWVTVPASAYLGSVTLDEEALKAFHAAHKDLYLTEERAAVEYIELNIEAFAQESAVSEEQLREYYESNKERYTTVGRRRVSHILIEAKGDEAAAEAKAKSAYERARGGEDFAALARELSADAGSASAGGDLGWSQRSDFVTAFGDAVWEMTPGEIRGPVRSEFGWHVIRLEEIEQGSTGGFEEVRAQLETELQRAEVEKTFGDLQEQLDTLAFEAAGNLSNVAAGMGLPIQRIERFTRSGGGGLGALPALIEAVFSPEVLAGREVRTVELAAGRAVAVRVASHDPPRERTLDEVRDQVTAAARQEKAQGLATGKATAIAAELTGGADWATATKSMQAPVADPPTHQPRLVGREEAGIPAEVASAAFRAPRPEGRARFGTAVLASGDVAVWQLSGVRSGSMAALAPAERQREVDGARERVSSMDAGAYVSAMRAAADVDVNPQVFE